MKHGVWIGGSPSGRRKIHMLAKSPRGYHRILIQIQMDNVSEKNTGGKSQSVIIARELPSVQIQIISVYLVWTNN